MELASVQEQFAQLWSGKQARFRRFYVQLPITVKLEDGRIQHDCHSRNISPRGICFEFPTSLELGAPLELLLTIPEQVTKGEPILVRLFCKVARVQRGRSESGKAVIAATIERYEFVQESPQLWQTGEEQEEQEEQKEDARQTAADPPPCEVKREPIPCFRLPWSDAADPLKVDQLFAAFLEAKRRCGENTNHMSSDAFKRFVQHKTEQLQRDFGSQQLEYVVEVGNGQVKLKAKVI